MSEKGVSRETKLRFVAFAGVLLLVSGLVVALFDEARAVGIEVDGDRLAGLTTGTGSRTINIDVTIPDGQRLPVQSTRVIIERDSSSSFSTTGTKTSAAQVTAAAAATCTAPFTGCSSTTTALTATTGTAITAMGLNDFYLNQVGDAYSVSGGYFATGAYSAFNQAYGYSNAAGYGYVNAGSSGYHTGTGGAYGYGGETLIIRFTVTFNPGALGGGNYWMTFLADSGSGALGLFSSPAKAFTISSAGGGGGGGDSTTPTDPGGDGPPTTLTVDATSISPTGAAVAAYRSTVASLAADGSLVISIPGDPLIGDLTFVPGSELTNADITVQRFTADQPPADVGSLPSGVSVAGFIQVTVSSGGTTHQITVALTVPEADAGDPEKAVLIKWDDASDGWAPHGRIGLTLDGGVYSGTGTAPCCSFFAVAFDEEDPTVSMDAPDGDLTGTVQLTATADDNLGVQKVEFWAGETLLGTDSSEPWSLDLDTTALANGDHTIRAVAYDHVDNTAESSQDITVQNEESPGPTGDTDGTPGGDDGDDGGFNFGVLLLVLIVLAVIGFAGYYFYKQQGEK